MTTAMVNDVELFYETTGSRERLVLVHGSWGDATSWDAMVEPAASSNLVNVANPMAPFMYTVSTLHCMTVSLAHGGAGLGTVWGEQRARQMLADTEFGDVAVHPAPGDPLNAISVTTRPAPLGAWANDS